jgi:hypothetical protein
MPTPILLVEFDPECEALIFDLEGKALHGQSLRHS